MLRACVGKLFRVKRFANVMRGCPKEHQLGIHFKAGKFMQKSLDKFSRNIMNQSQVGHQSRWCLNCAADFQDLRGKRRILGHID